MARAIAFFRQSQIAQAETLMDGLVKENPNDAFLYDLRGQILFESAKTSEALASYRSANKLLPNNALIMIDLGKSEMAQGTPENIASAVAHLERATTLEPFNSFGWRQLATAYSKQHNEPMAHLALAEEALLDGDVAQTIAQSDLAINTLTNASARLRAQDVKTRALQMQKEQADAKSIF
jgi:predicted Zn-dependent protease